MKLNGLIFGAAACLASLGCSSRMPVTSELRSQVGDEDLARVQLYVSAEIILQRVLKSEKTGVTASSGSTRAGSWRK
jgi:hypothetical protein